MTIRNIWCDWRDETTPVAIGVLVSTLMLNKSENVLWIWGENRLVWLKRFYKLSVLTVVFITYVLVSFSAYYKSFDYIKISLMYISDNMNVGGLDKHDRLKDQYNRNIVNRCFIHSITRYYNNTYAHINLYTKHIIRYLTSKTVYEDLIVVSRQMIMNLSYTYIYTNIYTQIQRHAFTYSSLPISSRLLDL